MEDRRVFARIRTRLPLRFLCPDRKKECRAETVDISANGMGFLTEEKLSAHTPVEIWLDISDHHEPFYTRGEVVYFSPSSETAQYRTGVRLEKAELMGLARILWR